MSELSSKTACVIDSGLFLTVALHLSEAFNKDGFGRVLYHTPYDEDHHDIKQVCYGDGFGRFGVERCDDIWVKLNEIDLFVFPDNGHAGLQAYLQSIGKAVVGSKRGQELELYRRRFRKLQSKLHMDVPEYVVKIGVSALAAHLAPLEDKYIKVDRFRANMETFHWRNWTLDEGELDRLAVKFGPFKEQVPFLVEDAIKTDVENGGDFFILGDQVASHCVIGVEDKNQAYAAFLRPYADLDEQIKDVISPLLPALREFGYCNFLSTEQRKTKTDNVLIDITTRLGFPSGSCQIQLYGNLPGLLNSAANGELVPIDPAGKVCFECLIDHCGSTEDWRSIQVPKELWPWFNPKECCLNEDTLIFTPNGFNTQCIGSVNGLGDTVEEAYEHLTDNLELLKGEPVSYRLDSFKDLLEEVKTAEQDHDIEFTDQPLPELETVLNGE